jgi:hypothetical protein
MNGSAKRLRTVESLASCEQDEAGFELQEAKSSSSKRSSRSSSSTPTSFLPRVAGEDDRRGLEPNLSSKVKKEHGHG